MLSDIEFNVEVTVAAAVNTAIAFTGDSQLLTALNAGRNVDFYFNLLGKITGTLALAADTFDLFTGTITVRTCGYEADLYQDRI